MWGAIVAIIGVLAAAVGYWLKKSADHTVEDAIQLKNDLTKALKSAKLREQHIRRLRALTRKYRSELVRERRERLSSLSAADAADLLRRGLKADSPTESTD